MLQDTTGIHENTSRLNYDVPHNNESADVGPVEMNSISVVSVSATTKKSDGVIKG
jgi:hypothetical protein